MNLLALWIGKTTQLVLKLVGKRGAALPGLIVENLAPNFLDKNLSQLKNGVILVSGTNGKTTTTKMLTQVLSKKHSVLTNPTGSNFTRGVVSTLLENSNWIGGLKQDIAVLELDEAYAVKFIKQHQPRGVIVLNIMRDQMDRFGEIDTTAKMLSEVVVSSREFVVLNQDDTRTEALKKNTKKRVLFFGVSANMRDLFRNDDELHDKKPVVKKSTTSLVELTSIQGSQANYLVENHHLSIVLNSSGAHNAQNAAAVLATVVALDENIQSSALVLSEVKPAFGRGEKFVINNRTIILQLVKNPGGFRHSLISGAQEKVSTTMIAINDDYADGRDVSWLWDVNFEDKLHGEVVTTGVRAYDIALRLKYDDIATSSINTDLKDSLKNLVKAVAPGNQAIIYTTYTAMLALRKYLAEYTEVEQV